MDPLERQATFAESRLPIIVDGLRLPGAAYVPDGARALVLLLHGIPSINPPDPGDTGYPGLALRFAAEGFAAAWVDMRAARKSPGFFSIEGWVRDALAALYAASSLDGAQGLPVAIVGSSAGGAVAVEVAKRGASVKALCLLAAPATWLSFAEDPAEGLRRITVEAGMPVAPAVLEDPTEWAAEFQSVQTEMSIAQVGCPILIVHGTEDDVVPVDHAQRIADRSARAELRIIEGASHHLRSQEGVVTMVIDFLRRQFA